MEAKDLHIDDWILFADVPCKVIGITMNTVTIGLSNFDNCKNKQACVDVVDISPIPLTEELLIKNGYVNVDEYGSYYRFNIIVKIILI